MKQLTMILGSFVLLLLAGSSCNKPSQVELDIFDDQLFNVISSDTFSINARTVQAAPPQTRAANSNILNGLFLGNFDDPALGNVRSDIYARFLPLGSGLEDEILGRNPGDIIMDSVVLSLAYRKTDDARFYSYGKTYEPVNIEVFKVTEQMNDDLIFLADKVFGTESMPFAAGTFAPDIENDSVNILDISAGVLDTTQIPAQLRIRLDNSLGEDVLGVLDTGNVEDNLAAIEEVFKGLCIKVAEPAGGMLAFNPLSVYTGINVYFRTVERDTIDNVPTQSLALRKLVMPALGFYHNNYSHDYTGAFVEEFLDSETAGDSLLFLQGMQGLEILLEFPGLESLENVTINSAILEFHAIEMPDDDRDLYPLPVFVQVLETIAEQDYLIEDLSYAENAGISITAIESSPGVLLFGGNPVETTINNVDIFRYSMNLSAHLQRIIDGEREPKLKLSPAFQTSLARRLAFAGKNFPDLKPRLKIAYTDLN